MKQKILYWIYVDLVGFFGADPLTLFRDINWVQRGIRQGHIEPIIMPHKNAIIFP